MSHKPQIFCSWGLKSNFSHEKPIEIYVDSFPRTPKSPNVVRIIIIQETYNTQGVINSVMRQPSMYDYVFTYLDHVLRSNSKAREFLCIKTWITDNIDNFSKDKKEFGVTSLIGGKNFPNLEGHAMRHQLWKRQNEITIPKKIYLSSHYRYGGADYNNNLILGDKKEPLFNTMFHIAIENTSINNMFTEKLIDCFQTKTIPIYYGVKNVEKYFISKGMLIANSIDEIIKLANSVTPELYEEKYNIVERNYLQSFLYTNHTEILDRKLNEVLNEKV